MKKYIIFLFVIIFSLFITNVGSVRAANCAPGEMFNTSTGDRCGGSSVALKCHAGDLFSSVTGVRCTAWEDNSGNDNDGEEHQFQMGERGDTVRMFQQMLKDNGFLSGKVDGIYGRITDGAAKNYYKKFPRPCMTPASNNAVWSRICPPVSDDSSVVISGVSGPQTLKVNEQGKWEVTAYDKNGGNLSYGVVWGDEIYASILLDSNSGKRPIPQQSATFTHSYSQAGIYNPTFTVTSENTIRCITTPCPSNGGTAQTSLSVNVGNINSALTITNISPLPNAKVGNNYFYNFSASGGTGSYDWALYQGPVPQGMSFSTVLPECADTTPNSSSCQPTFVLSGTPTYAYTYRPTVQVTSGGQTIKKQFTLTVDPSSSITVLSPNGGEEWVKGTTKNITWKDNYTTPPCPAGTGCYKPAPKYYDVTLVLYNTCRASGTEACAAWSSMEKTIAKNIYGSSYSWLVGEALDGATISNDSAYKIQICQTGTSICDQSNNYFTITSPTTISDDGTACLGGPTGCVRVTSLSPSFGSSGTLVTIKGAGFTPKGNIVQFGKGGDVNGIGYASDDGKTLTFSVPFYSTYTGVPLQAGDYSVTVTNYRGTSIPVTFSLTNLIR